MQQWGSTAHTLPLVPCLPVVWVAVQPLLQCGVGRGAVGMALSCAHWEGQRRRHVHTTGRLYSIGSRDARQMQL